MSWFSIFKRADKIAEAKANSAIDTMENPVEMTQQAIRDLSEKLQHAIEAQVKVKALIIQRNTDAENSNNEAIEWEKKANYVLDQIDNKKIDEGLGNDLAGKAALQSQQCLQKAEEFRKQAKMEQQALDTLSKEVDEMRSLIEGAKTNLTNLKARQETAQAIIDVNKELADDGSVDNAKALLQRMEDKTKNLEAMGEAYGQLNSENQSTMEKIDSIWNSNSENSALEALKNKRKSAS